MYLSMIVYFPFVVCYVPLLACAFCFFL